LAVAVSVTAAPTGADVALVVSETDQLDADAGTAEASSAAAAPKSAAAARNLNRLPLCMVASASCETASLQLWRAT
jgi:hypothetical protein